MNEDLSWLATPEAQSEIMSPKANLRDNNATAIYSCAGPGQLVVEAVSHGLGIPLTPPKEYDLNKTAVMWGILRGSGDVLRKSQKYKQTYYFCDHAYFLRGHSGTGSGPGRKNREQHYRIVKNAMQLCEIQNRPSDRWETLCRLGGSERLRIDPWQKNGRHIVITPPSEFFSEFFALKHWLHNTVEEIKKHTDRPIVIRQKPEELRYQDYANRPLYEDLKDAWALVTWRSNTAVEAALLGIPVFCDAETAAAPIGLQDLSKVESPVYPDREPWCWSLAYGQYSRKELLTGEWVEIANS